MKNGMVQTLDHLVLELSVQSSCLLGMIQVAERFDNGSVTDALINAHSSIIHAGRETKIASRELKKSSLS